MPANATRPSRRRIPSWLPQVLGYCLSAACLIWVLHGYSLQELTKAIGSLDRRWVLLSVVADLTLYVVHAWRWNTLLAPVARLKFWRIVQAIYIGLFANEVLPLRTGEVIRCYLLAHWNDLRLSLSFASAAVERLIDGFWLMGAFLITASFVSNIPRDLVILVEILSGFLVLGAILLAWVVTRKHEAHAIIRESRWSSTLRHVIEGLHLMGNRRTLILSGIYQPAVPCRECGLYLCADESLWARLQFLGLPAARSQLLSGWERRFRARRATSV